MSQKINLWWNKSRRAQTSDDYETWVEGGVVPTMNAFDNGDTRATTVIIAISFLAYFVPNLSIISAHFKVNNRAYSISILDCEISNWIF